MEVEKYLSQTGILGMKWGRRRYQNSDGSLTPAGRLRYGVGDPRTKTKDMSNDELKTRVNAVTSARNEAKEHDTLSKTYKKMNRSVPKDEIKKDKEVKEKPEKETHVNTKKKVKLNKLSDAELDAYITRLTKEKTAKDLYNQVHPVKQKTKNFVLKSAEQGLSNASTELVRQGSMYVGAAVGNKVFSELGIDTRLSQYLDGTDVRIPFSVKTKKKKDDDAEHSAFSNDSVGTFLEHHGILGQKWGDRNGPPYPLNSSDHSAAEKKANKYLEKATKRTYKLAKKVYGNNVDPNTDEARDISKNDEKYMMYTKKANDILSKAQKDNNLYELKNSWKKGRNGKDLPWDSYGYTTVGADEVIKNSTTFKKFLNEMSDTYKLRNKLYDEASAHKDGQKYSKEYEKAYAEYNSKQPEKLREITANNGRFKSEPWYWYGEEVYNKGMNVAKGLIGDNDEKASYLIGSAMIAMDTDQDNGPSYPYWHEKAWLQWS